MMPYTKQPDTGRHPRGAALALVVIAVIIAAVLALTFIAAQSTSSGIMLNARHQLRARAIAEAGLEMVIAEVRSNADWRSVFVNGTWVDNATHNGGTYTIVGEDGDDLDGDGVIDGDGDLTDDANDPVTITVVGNYKGVAHMVQAVVVGSTDGLIRLLLVVPDPKNLDEQYRARRKQATAWGFKVTLIDDGSTQSEFDEAVAAHDVVWVADSSTATSVGSKLFNAPIGVVNEAPGLWDEFGFTTSSAGTSSANDIDIVDNSHYITEPFATGLLSILNQPKSLARSGDAIAPGADRLADGKTLGTRTLLTLDAGRQLAETGTAVGRRAVIPYGRVDELNDNGKTIVKRALEWAAAPPVGPPPLAHWPLDETTGIVAHDIRRSHDGDVNGAGNWQLGQVAGALSFDGSNDFIRIPHHDDFNVTSALSVTAWINGRVWGSSVEDVDPILRKGEGNPNVWQFSIRQGRPTLFLEDYDDYGIRANTVLDTNRWYHVAATWDGSTVRIYIDGVLDHSESRSAPIGTDSRPPYIGGRAGTTDLFNGLMDDVRFYNRALNAAEIKVLFEEGGKGDFTPRLLLEYAFEEVKPSPALVGHWQLEETGGGGGGLVARSRVRILDHARVDSYSSSAGAYSKGNSGIDALVGINSTSDNRFHVDTSASLFGHAFCGAGGDPDDVIEAHPGAISGNRLAQTSNADISDRSSPTGLPSSSGNQTISGPAVWSTNRTYDNLTLASSAVVTVNGSVTVHVRSQFEASGLAQVVIPAGSRLTMYVGGAVTLSGSANVHGTSADPGRLILTMYHNSYSATVRDTARLGARLHSDNDLTVRDNARFFGSAKVRDQIVIEDTARVHVDVDQPGVGITDALAVDVSNADAELTNSGYYRNGASGLQSGARAFTGNAVRLDGTNDFIEIPHHDAYLLRSGAVALWFKTDNASRTQGLLCKDASGFGSGGHLNMTLIGGRLRARLSGTSSTAELMSSSLQSDRWYHAIVAFGPDGVRLYVDGALVDTDSYVGGLGTTSGGKGNYSPLVVGVDTSGASATSPSGWSNPFIGDVDDVRIYNYALDDTQAGELFNNQPFSESTLPGSVVADTGPIGGTLDLLIPNTSLIAWQGSGGLTVQQALSLVSDGPATKVHDGLRVNDEMSIELIFAPADNNQNAPVVSYAAGSTNRNFTFSQTHQTFTSRLRTGSTSSAGSPELATPNVLEKDLRQHVVVTFDQTTLRVYHAGNLVASEPLSGDFSTWDMTHLLAVANDVTGSKPWLGTLHRLAVYDRAFNDIQIRNVFNGLPPGDGLAPNFRVRWMERP